MDTKVIVDFRAYYACNKIPKITLSPRITVKSCSACEDELVEAPQSVIANRADGHMKVCNKLTDEEYILATPFVRGSELQTNKWGVYMLWPSFPNHD